MSLHQIDLTEEEQIIELESQLEDEFNREYDGELRHAFNRVSHLVGWNSINDIINNTATYRVDRWGIKK